MQDICIRLYECEADAKHLLHGKIMSSSSSRTVELFFCDSEWVASAFFVVAVVSLTETERIPELFLKRRMANDMSHSM